MVKPTFEQFVADNVKYVKRIINHRTWGRNDVDREDLLQEILMHFWKAWPSIDFKKNPKGFLLRLACRKVIDLMKDRNRRPRGIQDEDVWEIMSGDWSLREYLDTRRKRDEPPPEPLPWTYDLAEEDFRLVDLATAIVNVNRTSKGYLRFMAQWLPKSLQKEPYEVIQRWYKRIDNLKARRTPGGTEWTDERFKPHEGERLKLLEWTRKGMAATCLKIRRGKSPPMSLGFSRHELVVWKHRLYDKYSSRTTYAIGGNTDKIMGTLPSHVRDGDWSDPAFAFKACRWFRKNWNGLMRDIEEHGWKSWDDVRRIKASRRERSRYQGHKADITSRLNSPGVREKRRESSRKWNQAHRESCRLSSRRWKERRRNAGVSCPLV